MADLTPKENIQEQEYQWPYHYKDLLASGYKPLRLLEYTSKLARIKELIAPFTGQIVLDAGCGDGRFCFELKDEFVRVAGVDMSPRAVAYARAFCYGNDAEFLCQDLRVLDINERFDVITFLDTLEHVPFEEVPVVLERLHRHLRPGGRLIVSVPTWNTKLRDKHYQHFDRASLEETVGSGFRLVYVEGFFNKRKKFMVKQLQNVIGNLYTLLGKVGLYRPLNNFAIRYFRKKAAPGKPEDCLDMIAIFEKVEA